jgi:hypothetical protein
MISRASIRDKKSNFGIYTEGSNFFHKALPIKKQKQYKILHLKIEYNILYCFRF